MFAPLALKAVRPITVNMPVAESKSSKPVSHAGMIAGATVATLGALFSVIGVVTFVRRRRRRSIRSSIVASSSSSLIGTEPQVTPFHVAPPETMERDPESWMTGPQSQSMSLRSYDDAGASGSSSAPIPLPLSVPPMVPPPAGLSSKELARLRSEALARASNHSHSESSGSESVIPRRGNVQWHHNLTRGDYDQSLRTYVGRWTDFVRRDWKLPRVMRAKLGMHSRDVLPC
ncbi:hypothetical protein BGW80DRAFT_195489 [Lactifluus volemus]|nr:hypothetical protein BGW80DRAFT_195489 [Lactifluus volemus]